MRAKPAIRAELFIVVWTCAEVLITAHNAAEAESVSDAISRCNALASVDFSAIPDAATHVVRTKPVGLDSGAHCAINGFIGNPPVEFLLRLPATHWNGKFIEMGCGGECGTLEHIDLCDDPLRRGYACVVSDGGHKFDEATPMKWAYGRPQAAIEYFTRASHVTALAGKSIVGQYYGQRPNKSYFMGCSAGGVQAMWEAQMFPWDFDGIVAGGPALSLSRIWLNWLWANRAMMGGGGKAVLGRPELDTLHEAVVNRCDLNDGVKDGLIGDPRVCEFNPEELRCASDEDGHCLTAQQAEVAMRIYNGPRTSKGEQLAAPMALKGSEHVWEVEFAGDDSNPTWMYSYLKEWFRYSIFEIDFGATWRPADFDFDSDYKRLGPMEALEPIRGLDLRKFKGAGGKLLVYTGWSDAIEGVLNTTEYYEFTEKLMGGRSATQDFFRLFVVPDMGHCRGGKGASVIDWLGHLEAWVEKGQAPDSIIGVHIRSSDLNVDDEGDSRELERRSTFPVDPRHIEFSRPIYPYPIETKYKGHGEPKDASSFGPVQP